MPSKQLSIAETLLFWYYKQVVHQSESNGENRSVLLEALLSEEALTALNTASQANSATAEVLHDETLRTLFCDVWMDDSLMVHKMSSTQFFEVKVENGRPFNSDSLNEYIQLCLDIMFK